MVVDDDADVRVALGHCLRSEGWDVQLCTDGRDAIDRLGTDAHPLAIVLDLMMPRMNGLEMLQALRSEPRWSSIPVIVVSANRAHSAEDLGVSCLLRKPFELPDLIAALNSAAEARQ